MAQLAGHQQIFHSDTSIVDTSQKSKLGVRAVDLNGNEFIYLQGVSSVGAGTWVTYDEDYTTTLLTAGAVGPVAISMAAVDATSEYGWFQIFGKNTVAKTDTVAADQPLYIDGTNGRADDLGVSGDLIIGAMSLTADSNNVATVWISYPHVTGDLGGSSSTLSVETPTGDVDSSNTSYTVSNTPIFVVADGSTYVDGQGYSESGGTLTMTSPPALFIRSFY